MSSAAALHRSSVRLRAGRVHLAREDEPARKRHVSPEEGVVRTAVPLVMLASYRNQSLHAFVRPAMLAVAVRITGSTQRHELFAFFCFLEDVLFNEFIFVPGGSLQDFEEACALLQKCGAAHIHQQEVSVSDGGEEVFAFLQELLLPFIDSYQLVFRYLCNEGVHVFTEKDFLLAVSDLATKLILSGELGTYEALSSDTHKNALSALRRLQVVTKSRASERRVRAVRRTRDVISGKIPPQMLQATPDARL